MTYRTCKEKIESWKGFAKSKHELKQTQLSQKHCVELSKLIFTLRVALLLAEMTINITWTTHIRHKKATKTCWFQFFGGTLFSLKTLTYVSGVTTLRERSSNFCLCAWSLIHEFSLRAPLILDTQGREQVNHRTDSGAFRNVANIQSLDRVRNILEKNIPTTIYRQICPKFRGNTPKPDHYSPVQRSKKIFELQIVQKCFAFFWVVHPCSLE